MPRADDGEVAMSLPVPDSPNDAPREPGQRTGWKTEQKRRAFGAACQDCRPLSDPPSPVLVHALYRVPDRRYFRDDDNLVGGLKYVLDALKTPDPDRDGPMTYRGNLYPEAGWIVDDDPPHAILGTVDQKVSDEHHDLVINIVPIEED